MRQSCPWCRSCKHCHWNVHCILMSKIGWMYTQIHCSCTILSIWCKNKRVSCWHYPSKSIKLQAKHQTVMGSMKSLGVLQCQSYVKLTKKTDCPWFDKIITFCQEVYDNTPCHQVYNCHWDWWGGGGCSCQYCRPFFWKWAWIWLWVILYSLKYWADAYLEECNYYLPDWGFWVAILIFAYGTYMHSHYHPVLVSQLGVTCCVFDTFQHHVYMHLDS